MGAKYHIISKKPFKDYLVDKSNFEELLGVITILSVNL